MPVPRPAPPPTRASPALLSLLLLPPLAPAAAGCAGRPEADARPPRPPPPGFSADTFTREGLISGATATEAGCRALPDGLWADTGPRRECLRYAAGGAGRPARTALVHFPGDPPGVAYRFAGGRAGRVASAISTSTRRSRGASRRRRWPAPCAGCPSS
jgi:hypothetical protein